MEGLLELPFKASAHAAEIDRMTVLTHWLMLILFVGWGAYFMFVLFRFHHSRNPKADYTGVKTHVTRYIEIGIVVIEAVLLIGFAIPAWAHRVDAFPAEADAVVVKVVAEQFAWNIQYPGPDNQFGRRDITLVSPTNPLGLDRNDPAAKDDITTINQLNLPVDRPAIVHLESKDVIHSFTLLEMRVKQDSIPGLSIPVWFVPTEIGDYEIGCSQLCGLGHYRMRGFVTIQTDSDYQAWHNEEQALLQTSGN